MQQWPHELDPYRCGNILVLEGPNNGVGIILCLQVYMFKELAVYSINLDGSADCQVGFASREFSAGPNGKRFGRALVHLVVVFTVDNENGSSQHLIHHNHGYTITEVIAETQDLRSSN